jgi:hypothetical protein
MKKQIEKDEEAVKTQRCKSHKVNNMGYIEWHLWAEKKAKRGAKQKQCPKCFLWFFADEF